MIPTLKLTHEELRYKGYEVEQFIPYDIYNVQIEHFDTDSKRYLDLVQVQSQNAFEFNRFSPVRQGFVIYGKHTKKEEQSRKGLRHEIIVNMRDATTGTERVLDLSQLN